MPVRGGLVVACKWAGSLDGGYCPFDAWSNLPFDRLIGQGQTRAPKADPEIEKFGQTSREREQDRGPSNGACPVAFPFNQPDKSTRDTNIRVCLAVSFRHLLFDSPSSLEPRHQRQRSIVGRGGIPAAMKVL